MDNLSGGEKTVAALALLFAIHRWGFVVVWLWVLLHVQVGLFVCGGGRGLNSRNICDLIAFLNLYNAILHSRAVSLQSSHV